MLKFLKAVSAVVIGNLITCGIAFALTLFAIVVIIASLTPETPETRAAKHGVHDKSVLVLDLNLNITDTPASRSPAEIIGEAFNGGGETSVGLLDLTRAIDAAAKDRRITTLFLRGSLAPSGYGSGYAALAEVRRSIMKFRKAGKLVVAHLESPSLRDYYLGTTAEILSLHPSGELGVQGLSTNNAYLGAALKKYGVGVQTTKVGAYKSAVEPFTSDHMSDADRAQTEALLGSVWNGLTDDIADSRKLAPDTLRKLADSHGILSADEAVKLKLADRTAHIDEIIEDLKKRGAEDSDTGSFVQVNMLDYMKLLPKEPTLETYGDKIAVVYAEGEIVDGPGHDHGAFGGEWLASEIRRLRRDDSVKAVVLRVNSPGGSAFASEVARRELELFRESGRPLIVSMGSLAASGGYWISAGADRIFAEKTTITGSIGVFGLMFDVKDLASGFGVKFDGVKTSRFADMDSLSRPKTPDELALLQKFTDRIYGDFIGLVAKGRRIDRPEVERIAQGRVWSGDSALGLRLVDEIGGLDSAILAALTKTRLSVDAPIVQIPGKQDPSEALASLFAGDRRKDPVAKLNSPATRLMRITEENLRRIDAFNDRRHVYARIPYLLDLN
jgi:protease-4